VDDTDSKRYLHIMKLRSLRPAFFHERVHILIAIVCLVFLPSSSPVLLAQQPEPQPDQSQATTAQEKAPKIPNEQLDSLVAPIALFPDALLAQTLAASTYPLEIVELEQWLKRNANLKDQALADAVAKQPWDPSIQALAIFPDVVTRLSANVAWATNLGNAFLAQPQDVMDAVQRMRAKAQSKGALKTTEQQKVETETVEGGEEAIVIEPANSQYAFVPSYDPEVVYGDPGIYPYPAYYYPGYVPGMGLAFGTGVILGAAWANNWGNCNWGHGDITINNKNNFNKNNINNINSGANRTNVNRGQQSGKWQHNAQHRGGAPYGDRNTANKYGGRARQQPGGAANRGGGASGLGGGAGFAGGAGNRSGSGGAGNIGAGNRPGGGLGAGGGAGNLGSGNRLGSGTGRGTGATAANRPGGGASAGARPSTGVSSGFGGGGSSIGNRSVSPGSGFGSSSNAFGDAGFSGSSARSASSRGGHSMGGGGFSGGGRGGGGRGGGGGGRR
jgi:Protein of unknown function (DUF3300)